MSANCLRAKLQSSFVHTITSTVHLGSSDSLVDNTPELEPGRLVQLSLDKKLFSGRPHQFWIPALNKGGSPKELPSCL